MTKAIKKNVKKETKKAEVKKSKDPKRVAAAHKAWITIRSGIKTEEQQSKVQTF